VSLISITNALCFFLTGHHQDDEQASRDAFEVETSSLRPAKYNNFTKKVRVHERFNLFPKNFFFNVDGVWV
jgi:hypothetical protein